MSPTGPPMRAPAAAWPIVLPMMAPVPAPKPAPINPPFSRLASGVEHPAEPISKLATSNTVVTLVFVLSLLLFMHNIIVLLLTRLYSLLPFHRFNHLKRWHSTSA